MNVHAQPHALGLEWGFLTAEKLNVFRWEINPDLRFISLCDRVIECYELQN